MDTPKDLPDGDPEAEVERFLKHLASGEPAADYQRRYGHFGPAGRYIPDTDPPAKPPALLEALGADDTEMPPDAWDWE